MSGCLDGVVTSLQKKQAFSTCSLTEGRQRVKRQIVDLVLPTPWGLIPT